MPSISNRLIPLILGNAKQCVQVTSLSGNTHSNTHCISPSLRQYESVSQRLTVNCSTTDIERTLLNHHFYASLNAVRSTESRKYNIGGQIRLYHGYLRHSGSLQDAPSRRIHTSARLSVDERVSNPMCPDKKCTIKIKTRIKPEVRRRPPPGPDDDLLTCAGCPPKKIHVQKDCPPPEPECPTPKKKCP